MCVYVCVCVCLCMYECVCGVGILGGLITCVFPVIYVGWLMRILGGPEECVSLNIRLYRSWEVCAYVCVCACVCACVRVYVRI